MKKITLLFAVITTVVACNNNADKKDTADSPAVHDMDHTGTNASNDTTGRGNMEVNDTDREFALKAGMGNTAEVEAGAMAAEKSTNKDIKDFGSMMVKDHGDAQAKLKGIASSLSLNAPDSVDQEHKDMKTKLSGLSGKAFDTEYIAAQVKDHSATIALFEKEISNGINAQLKEFASATLPHIKMHLEKAEGIAGKK